LNMAYFSKIGYFSNIAYFLNLYLSRLLENLPRPTIKHLHQVFSSRVSTTVKWCETYAIAHVDAHFTWPECVSARGSHYYMNTQHVIKLGDLRYRVRDHARESLMFISPTTILLACKKVCANHKVD